MTRRIPPEEACSRAEVETAIGDLTDVQLNKLQRASDYLIRGLGQRCEGRTADDLLQEAMVASLDPERRQWRRGIRFHIHLYKAMRSIANYWYKTSKDGPIVATGLYRTDAEGKPVDPMEQAAGPQRDCPDGPRHHETIDELKALFRNDQQVLEVIDHLAAGMSTPDIQQILGLTVPQYETVMKRMRRRSRAAIPEENRYV